MSFDWVKLNASLEVPDHISEKLQQLSDRLPESIELPKVSTQTLTSPPYANY